MSLATANLLLFFAGCCLLYPLPALIAWYRGHRNTAAILCLNVLLGWTFLGWVASLVWAVTESKTKRR